jgi:hypothetical protein
MNNPIIEIDDVHIRLAAAVRTVRFASFASKSTVNKDLEFQKVLNDVAWESLRLVVAMSYNEVDSM